MSLTSIIAKICETVVKDRWSKHLEENNLRTDKRLGFRKRKLCTASLISFHSRVIDEIQERDGWVGCIYLD